MKMDRHDSADIHYWVSFYISEKFVQFELLGNAKKKRVVI